MVICPPVPLACCNLKQSWNLDAYPLLPKKLSQSLHNRPFIADVPVHLRPVTVLFLQHPTQILELRHSLYQWIIIPTIKTVLHLPFYLVYLHIAPPQPYIRRPVTHVYSLVLYHPFRVHVHATAWAPWQRFWKFLKISTWSFQCRYIKCSWSLPGVWDISEKTSTRQAAKVRTRGKETL